MRIEKMDLTANYSGYLRLLFPETDWNKVSFRTGLPWYMRKSSAFATVLPHSLSSNKLKVYFKDFDKENRYIISTLVHEAVHVQQYQDLDKKWPYGFSFFRCFLWHYLGWFIALFVRGIFIKKLSISKASEYAYREHPLEIEAFNREKMFWDSYMLMGGMMEPVFFVQLYPATVMHHSSYSGRPPLWAFIPAIIFSLMISLVKPIMEFFILIYSLILSQFIKKKG